MVTLLIVSIILFVSYIGYAIGKNGVPASISDTYYQFGKKGWLFTVFCLAESSLLIASFIEASREEYQFLAFISSAALAFVGAAPLFKEDFNRNIHYTSAGICALASLTWQMLMGMWYVPLITFLGGVIVLACLKFKKPVFWMEMCAFISTYITLLLLY